MQSPTKASQQFHRPALGLLIALIGFTIPACSKIHFSCAGSLTYQHCARYCTSQQVKRCEENWRRSPSYNTPYK
ncbi:MAG: hypothetical protein CL923_07225 [Deltaproteobacteria bacterium]|nr:hypothetical protein [Deltaproteobacteria bacterium]MBQ32330.1 hypothetical protein [Deltaproteobacteria bacterium]